MKLRRQLVLTLSSLLLFFCTGTALFAQDQDNANNQAGDPPARVARLQYISGEVSMQPGGVNDWVAASLNRPLTTSDRVWTDKDSRAELNVGNAFLRLNSETSVTLTNVSDNTMQVQLDQGTVELTVRHLEPGEIFEIDTPNLAFTVMKSGVYRLDVPANDNQTWVTVRKGYGEATGSGPAVKVSSGNQFRFTGQGTLQNASYSAPSPDGFDDWAQVRDKRLESSVSARYVAPGVIGYEDLDYYGTWQVVPTYGAIWVPTGMPAGWAPYRYGHWAWVAPWGWTWVDNAAWGFAPYHYGRWVSYGGYWGWAPGPVYAGWRPYYAPALVGWVGGAGWGVSVSFGFGWGGACGWFPLGWGEPYYPWYHGYRGGYVSQTYVRNVNVTNTNINNINNITNNYYHGNINNTHYANRTIVGGVTAAPKSALVGGQNIASVGRVVPRSELGKGEIQRSADVSPTRQSMFGGQMPRTNGVPPRNAVDRPVVTRTSVPPSQAVSQTRNAPSAASSQMVRAADAPGNPRAMTSTTMSNAEAQHVVPKPPYAGSHAPAMDTQSAARSTNSSYGSASTSARNDVPRPPYAGGRAPTAESASHGASSQATTPRSVNTNPPQASHGERQSQQNSGSKAREAPKANPGMASSNVARPPAGYTYHAAPAYNASSYSGGNNNGYSGGSRSYSNPAPSYRGGGYSSAPAYSARMTAPSTPRYSAPSYSGGGRSSGGGGGSHASGGGNSGHHR